MGVEETSTYPEMKGAVWRVTVPAVSPVARAAPDGLNTALVTSCACSPDNCVCSDC